MQRIIVSLIICLVSVFSLSAQGIEFMEGNWKEALAKAEKENKIIFVDAYAEWCGPCKRMAATVFTTKEAGDYYNKNFINFKIDMEKGEGPSFGRKYPVRAYPTLMFIDASGELVHLNVGAQSVSSHLSLGNTALGKVDRSGDYAEKYEKGDRSAELVYNYIAALNQAGKPSLKIANEYLRKPDGDLKSETNLKIIFESLQQVDSRIYSLFDQYQQPMKAIFSQDEIDQKVLAAGESTLETAITFESSELLAEAQQKVGAQCSESVANAFRAKSELIFNFNFGDEKAYAAALKDYSKELAGKSNITENYDIVKQGLKRWGEKKVEKELVALMETVANSSSATYEHWITYGSLLNRTGDTKAAMKALDQAKEMTKNNRILARIDKMREQILNK
jgi:thiol-disulfide isomerase/thioredoxin